MSKDFSNELLALSKRIEENKAQIKTEEATKMSFIVPFFQILGYDVFNPAEFVPEFVADVGTKKDEKVDYAILENNKPIIIIEAKCWTENLDNHINQLYRYFGVTNSKFGILTNGIEYRFYTDLEELNKMDTKPFLKFTLLDLKENVINELKKFKKDKFNVDEILTTAEELKYSNSILNLLSTQYNSPSDDFVKFILGDIYDGLRTQSIIEKFRPIIKKSFILFVNELINDKLKTAFEENAPKVEISATSDNATNNSSNLDEKISKIITTEEEIEAFYITKSILAETVELDKVVYKDTETYFGILYENNTRKWICRYKLSDNRKILIIPDKLDNKKEEKIYLNSLNDIYTYKNNIIESCKRFL